MDHANSLSAAVNKSARVSFYRVWSDRRRSRTDSPLYHTIFVIAFPGMPAFDSTNYTVARTSPSVGLGHSYASKRVQVFRSLAKIVESLSKIDCFFGTKTVYGKQHFIELFYLNLGVSIRSDKLNIHESRQPHLSDRSHVEH